MRVVIATAESFGDPARLHRKLDRILGGLERLVVHCRRRERAAHDWCSKRIGGLYCVWLPGETDAEMLEEVDLVLVFLGPQPCEGLEKLLEAAKRKDVRFRIIKHKEQGK